MKKHLLLFCLGLIPMLLAHSAVFIQVENSTVLDSNSKLIFIQGATNAATVYVLKANSNSFSAQATTYTGGILNFSYITATITVDVNQHDDFLFQTVDANENSKISRLKGKYGYIGLNGNTIKPVDGNSGSANMWNIPSAGSSGDNLYTSDFASGYVYFGSTSPSVTAYSSLQNQYKQAWRAFCQAYSVTLNAGSGSCSSECLYCTSRVQLPICVAPTGKTFMGWSTSPNRADLLPSLLYEPTNDITLYAIYTDAETDGTYMKVTLGEELAHSRNKVVLAFQEDQTWYALTGETDDWVRISEVSVVNNEIINPDVTQVMIVDGKSSYIYNHSGFHYMKQNGSYFSGTSTFNQSTCWMWSIPCGVGGAVISTNYSNKEYRIYGMGPTRPNNVYTGQSNFGRAENFCTFKKASTISFNVGAGECDDANDILCISTILPEASATQEGYAFVGWNDGEQTYPAGTLYVPFGDVTLTAQYAPIKVTYYPGEHGTCDQTEFTGAKVTFTACVPDEGYRFLGWSTKEGSSIPRYFAGQTISLTKAMNLYAVYTSSETYSPINALTDLADGDVIMLVARDGHDLSDCKIAEFVKNGSSYAIRTVEETAENNILIPRRTTMLLHVEKISNNRYKFYYEAPGDIKYYLQPNESAFWQEGSSSDSWVLEWLSSSSVKIMKYNQTSTFLSWVDKFRIKNDQFNDQIALGADFTWNSGAFTIFKAREYYTLSLNADGGECSQTVFLNGTSSLPQASKTGYLFGGWTDGTTYYDAGEAFPSSGDLTSDITLNAVFVPASQRSEILEPVEDLTMLSSGDTIYVLMEDGNGGGAQYPLCHYSNYFMHLETSNLTEPSSQTKYIWRYGVDEYGQYLYFNYDMDRYLYTNCTPKTTGRAVEQANYHMPIIYQHLSGNRYNIKLSHYVYQKYQGYVSQNNSYYLCYNTAYGIPSGETIVENICTRSNAVNQWQQGKNLDEYTYNTSTSTYTPSAWSIYRKGYSFSCNLTFETPLGNLLTVGDGWSGNTWSGAGSCPLPTIDNIPDGYSFIGWTSNEVDVLTGASFTPRENLTFTAVFELIEYTYQFNVDNAKSGDVAPISGTVESPITMPNVEMTDANYAFLGWSTTSGGDVVYTAGSVITPSSDQTLYAVYTPVEYTVNFNAGEGSCIPSSYTGSVESSVTFPSANPPAGYDFVHWVNASDNTDIKEAGFVMFPASDMTYNAVYSLKSAIEISQDEDPTSLLVALLGEEIDVTLSDRSLIGGIWNTFCLPFTLDNLEGTPLAECQIAEYVQSVVSGGEVTLGFNYATSLEAGKPYLIKPAQTLVAPLIFNDVIISATTGQTVLMEPVAFIASLKPNNELIKGDTNTLFLNASGNLFYAAEDDDTALPGLRAYFLIQSTASQIPVRIKFSSMTPTDISPLHTDEVQCYKIIDNGRIYVIRNGVKYNLQGAIVK